MDDKGNNIFAQKAASAGEAFELIERLFDIAKPNAVYTDPVAAGEYTVITASELVVSMGAGYGGGYSPGVEGFTEDENNGGGGQGYGGGGGGGGFSMGRPVAAITIGPDGVKVEPIVDPTKIAIAFFTTFAAMIMTLRQIFRFKETNRLT